jgi:hypothetical protein
MNSPTQIQRSGSLMSSPIQTTMPSPESTTSEVSPTAYRSMAQFGRTKTEHVCSNCKTTDTPVWRRDVAGRHVCNACGIYSRVHKQDRPIQKSSDDTPKVSKKRKLSDQSMSPGEYRYRQQLMMESGYRSALQNAMSLPLPVRSRLPIFAGLGSQFRIASQSNRPMFPAPHRFNGFNGQRNGSEFAAQNRGPIRPPQNQPQNYIKLAPIRGTRAGSSVTKTEKFDALALLADEAITKGGQMSVKSLIA